VIIQGYDKSLRKRRIYRPFTHKSFVVTLEHRRFINRVNMWYVVVTGREAGAAVHRLTLEITEPFECMRQRIKNRIDEGEFIDPPLQERQA
jgi:hypothetical protein